MSVSKKSEDALRSAMAAVLDRAPRDGLHVLTWNNVCAAARVPRATAARAGDIIDEWKASVKLARGRAPISKSAITAERPDPKEARDADTIRGLRVTVCTMANHIQVLSLALAKKDALLASLADTHGGGTVTVLSERRR